MSMGHYSRRSMIDLPLYIQWQVSSLVQYILGYTILFTATFSLFVGGIVYIAPARGRLGQDFIFRTEILNWIKFFLRYMHCKLLLLYNFLGLNFLPESNTLHLERNSSLDTSCVDPLNIHSWRHKAMATSPPNRKCILRLAYFPQKSAKLSCEWQKLCEASLLNASEMPFSWYCGERT